MASLQEQSERQLQILQMTRSHAMPDREEALTRATQSTRMHGAQVLWHVLICVELPARGEHVPCSCDTLHDARVLHLLGRPFCIGPPCICIAKLSSYTGVGRQTLILHRESV